MLIDVSSVKLPLPPFVEPTEKLKPYEILSYRDECYKDYILYANVSYYFENIPSLNTIYSGHNLENLQVMHVNANPSATYNIQDENDIGHKWLKIIKEFIDNL